MSYLLIVEIKGLPKMSNQLLRGHWRNAHGNKQTWHKLVAAKVGRAIPQEPLQKAKLTYTRFSSSEPDFDNLVSTFKPIQDALVKIGVLANDKSDNIGQPSYAWVKIAPRLGKIKIVVEEVIEQTNKEKENGS